MPELTGRGRSVVWLVALAASLGMPASSAQQGSAGWVIQPLARPGVLADRGQLRIVPALTVVDQVSRGRGTVLLPLASGRVVSLRLDRREEFESGYVASGVLTDSAGEGSLSVVGDTMSARLVVDGEVWVVRRDAGGHLLLAVDPASFPPDGEPVVPDAADLPDGAGSLQAADPQVGADASTVDVAVFYTAAALSRYSTLPGLTAEVNLAIANSNASFANAGLAHRFRLVGLEPVGYTESGSSSTDLSRVRATSDGFMDDVHTRRDALGADLVVLLTQPATPDVCGVGYVMTSNTTSFASYGFNVTIASCAAGNLTLAHESGHNMGLQHDPDNANFAGVTSYAYGHRVGGVGRTVMAYACETGTCARVQVFSSPAATLGSGVPAGIADQRDNARALDLTFPTVAAFRTASSTCSFDLSPTSAAVGAGGGVVAAAVTTSAGCAWDTSMGTTGVSASPSAGTGSGVVSLTVPANTGAARVLGVQVAGIAVSLSQAAACTVSVSPSSSTATWAAATGTLSVLVGQSCSGTWSVSSNQTWLTVTSAASGTGNGSVSWSLAANSAGTPATRSATVTVTLGAATATWSLTQSPPTMTVSPSRVLFRAARALSGAITSLTPEQNLPLTWDGPAAPSWTATIVPTQSTRTCATTAWLRLTPVSGTGAGTLLASVDQTALTGLNFACAAVQIAAAGYATATIELDLEFAIAEQTAAPFGFLDSPSDGASGLSGSIAVGGWALDDVGVDKVEIFRLSVASDPPAAIQPGGLVYVGRALFVSGARPDVLSVYGGGTGASLVYPQAQRGGWGLLLLTNALPHQGTGAPTGGQGTFTLVAIATDLEGRSAELGRRTISVDNAAATLPFGAIDTPGQGGVVPDTAAPFNNVAAYPVFGWALSPGGVCIATDGSTIDVLVDGLVVGHPTYNLNRADIATGYPGYCNSTGAVGVYYLDASALSDGLHTIAWRVRDGAGRTAEIGSRYFRVSRGTVGGG